MKHFIFIEPLETRIAPAAVASINLSGLDGSGGFKVLGTALSKDQLGISVSDAGDVNGDGIGDIIVGANRASFGGGMYAGASYVVFGKTGGFGATLDVSALDGTNGFKLRGEAASDYAGVSVSAAGDVNGDGFGDLIVGANGAAPNGFSSGASYVVFGKNTAFGATLPLSTLDGTNGFKIRGEATEDQSGFSVSGAGDVNGDGVDDLIVGASNSDPNGASSGKSYVVFGKRTAFASFLELISIDGNNGFRLQGEAQGDNSGFSVSGAGDVNGDGIGDLIVGAFGANTNGIFSGASYVVFGKSTGITGTLNLSTLNGTNGFKLQGEAFVDGSGASVSGAGDVNGDGFDDLIIGAPGAGGGAGASYVVFGKGTAFGATVNLSTLNGTTGFKLLGEAEGDDSGRVSGAGDVNGDGFDDLMVGAANAGASDSGAGYLVFGKDGAFGATLSLSALDGTNGFKLEGGVAGGNAGRSVSGAGDVNGDGFDDLIVGANGIDAYGNQPGLAYVVYGFSTGSTFSIDSVSVTEGDAGTSNLVFTVTLSDVLATAATVNFSTANDTATATGDYSAQTGTLTFAAGETSKTITVAVAGDRILEGDETFFVNLSAPTGATLGTVAQGVGTILENEAVPTLSIGDASVTEGNAGTANLVFTVTLSGASSLPVTVDFATADGTETEPGDFAAQTGTLTFAPGETIKTITVAVAGDPVFEGDEAFFVNLSNAVGATLGDAEGEGTIDNDDAAPVEVTVNAKTPFTFKDANNDTVTVKLKGAGTVTVSLVGGVETGADIAEISLTGTDAKSALSVTVKKDKVAGDGVVGIGEVVVNGALKSFTAKASDLTVDGLRASGPVKTITVRNFEQGEITTGGAATDKLALTLGVVSDGVVIQRGQTVSILKAVSLGEASVSAAAFGAISTSAGAMAADITSVGAIAKITTKGGGLSGALSAASFGAVSVNGGDFSGSLTSLTTAATLGKTKALKSLALTDGNLTGDVRLLGAAGVIGVKGKTLGGSITGASIVAASLAGVTTQRDVIGSVILAGADLGADFALGGGDDTFAGGSIAKVKIGGAVSGSTVIGAGLDPTDGIFANADDDVIGAVASVIKSFSITGTAAADSHFAAGLFKSAPKIAKVKVDAATDARFLIA